MGHPAKDPPPEPPSDDVLDLHFHGCAVIAYVEQARIDGGPPNVVATWQRAYRLYEDALAERNASCHGPSNSQSSSSDRAG